MKNKTKLSTAILIGSAVIGSTNCEAQVEKDSLELSNNPNKENQLEKKFPIIKKDSIELEKRLKELAETEYKGELKGGAMCYANAISVNKDYICPFCGKKTMRTNYDLWRIKKISKAVEEIKSLGYDAILNESEYCQFCSNSEYIKEDDVQSEIGKTTYTYANKNSKEPTLIFKIRFSKVGKYHVVKSNIDEDYLILLEFLKGNDKYDAGSTGELPLHVEIDVLKKMTGLGKNIITHKHYGYMEKEEFIEYLKELKYTDENIQKRIKEEDEYNERR